MSALNVDCHTAHMMLVWEFNHRIKGASDRELNEWRRVRWLGAVTLRPHTKKRIRPTDLFELPGDESAIPKPTMTREERMEDVEQAVEIWKRKLAKRTN